TAATPRFEANRREKNHEKRRPDRRRDARRRWTRLLHRSRSPSDVLDRSRAAGRQVRSATGLPPAQRAAGLRIPAEGRSDPLAAGPARQSTLAPETLTTSAHLAMSPRRNVSNSAVLMIKGSAPCSAHALRTSARLTTSTIAPLSFCTIAAGVP